MEHEWSTLVIMQATQLRKLAVGKDHHTIIYFHMVLYEKVVHPLDSRPDLKEMVVPDCVSCISAWLPSELLVPLWRTRA